MQQAVRPAVSVLNVFSPNETVSNPASFAVPISSREKSPSGPMRIQMDLDGSIFFEMY